MTIKPDPEGQNVRRAALAEQALEIVADDPLHDEPETALTDLLADLLHWCDFNDVDFTSCMAMANHHWYEETTEEEDD